MNYWERTNLCGGHTLFLLATPLPLGSKVPPAFKFSFICSQTCLRASPTRRGAANSDEELVLWLVSVHPSRQELGHAPALRPRGALPGPAWVSRCWALRACGRALGAGGQQKLHGGRASGGSQRGGDSRVHVGLLLVLLQEQVGQRSANGGPERGVGTGGAREGPRAAVRGGAAGAPRGNTGAAP